MMEGLGTDSEEKHEPVSDIDTVVVDGLKALDLQRPIREADFAGSVGWVWKTCLMSAMAMGPPRRGAPGRGLSAVVGFGHSPTCPTEGL
jgi:hypothetical protein